MDLNYVSGDEREALYNEVWTEPVTIVAKRYNMSDSTLRRHCRRLGIPLPTSGYWSKLKAGKNVAKTPLPGVIGEAKKHVYNYVIKYKSELEELNDNELVSDVDFNLLSNETIKFIFDKCSMIQVKTQLRTPHILIYEHKEESKNRKMQNKESIHSAQSKSYMYHNNLNYNKAILPINVSNTNINRAYRIMDCLINTLDEMEGPVSVDNSGGKDIGGFIIMRTIFYFEVKEEIVKKKSKQEINESKTKLVISFNADNSWVNISDSTEKFEFKDTDKEPLETQLGKIIYKIFVVANRFRAIAELEDRRIERKWKEEERKHRLEKMRVGELENIKVLEQFVSDWDKAQKIRTFIDILEQQINIVKDESKKGKILKWIEWSRNKADWLDPLIAKEDELLGENKHIFDIIAEDENQLYLD